MYYYALHILYNNCMCVWRILVCKMDILMLCQVDNEHISGLTYKSSSFIGQYMYITYVDLLYYMNF